MSDDIFDRLDPVAAARVLLTTSCHDTDWLPKVSDAGEVRSENGERVQVMHNGVLVAAGCYYGEWTTEIIRRLRGHHEPQEEVAFHIVLERLREDAVAPTILELGSFWAYYSLWFLQVFPDGAAYCVEPDPSNLAVGEHNFALNGRTGTFVQAVVGGEAAAPAPFVCESDFETRLVPTESLESLFDRFGLEHVDVLLADVQGAELDLLAGGSKLLRKRAVRFVVVSTHHHSISGRYLTHQQCTRLLENLGAHVIAEHSVAESYSGDGLIVASFDDRDRDLSVPITYARPGESLFGDPLVELAELARLKPSLVDTEALEEMSTSASADEEFIPTIWSSQLQAIRAVAYEAMAGVRRESDRADLAFEECSGLRDDLEAAQRLMTRALEVVAAVQADASSARAELDALRATHEALLDTRLYRYTSPIRRLYGRLRGRR